MSETGPIRPTDDEARALARDLLQTARIAALGVLDPDTKHPMVTRIAVAEDAHGLITLISDLSHHTRALKVSPACSLLLGEPGDKGDPLTHPRLTLQADAAFVPRGSEAHGALRTHWLETHPKAKLYIDFGDFAFVRFQTAKAFLNGGFGKAYVLAPEDLTP